MANKHSTLTSLFSDIANSIREVTDTTGTYVADTFPNDIINLGKPIATQWTSKSDSLIAPTLTTVSPGAIIEIKAVTYYDGYWYGVGNDITGDAYKLYGASTSALTAYKIGTSRNYPVTGIGCDGTYVWICCSSGSYSNRVLLVQPIENFQSSSTALSVWTSETHMFNDMASIPGVAIMAFGGYISGAGAAMYRGTPNKTASINSYASYVPETLVSGCAYKSTFIAVTPGGYIVQWHDPTNAGIYHKKLACLNGAQKCCQMGDYLCVACVRYNSSTSAYETYLSYTSSNYPTNGDWCSFKIADANLTIVGMAYANGLYTLVAKNGTDGTTTTVWQTTDLKDHGVYGQTMALSNGFIARAVAANGNYICVLADNLNGSVQKALITVA